MNEKKTGVIRVEKLRLYHFTTPLIGEEVVSTYLIPTDL